MFDPHPAQVHPHYYYRKVLLFIVLIAGIGLAYYIYSSPEGLTGAVIGVKNETVEPSGVPEFQISTELVLPELALASRGCKIDLALPSVETSDLSIGEEFNFRKMEKAELSLEGYQGKIILTTEGMVKLDGKTKSITLNGMTLDKKDKLFSLLTNHLKYSSMLISNITLEELTFISSGEFKVNEHIFKMAEQKARIKVFSGNIILENLDFRMEGGISSLKIEGYPEVNIG